MIHVSCVASMNSPEGWAPIVERGRVFRPRGTVVGTLERIGVLDRPPAWIERLFCGCGTHVAREAFFDCAKFFYVLLSFGQRDLVLAAGELRPAQLRQIVLPQADEANIVRAGRFF